MQKKNITETLMQHGQSHLLPYIDAASGEAREKLLHQIEGIDWSFLDYLHKKPAVSNSEIRPIDALSVSEIREKRAHFTDTGIEAIKAGKLCLVLLAGGQGTRLGYEQPKGTFNMGIKNELFIFQLLIEHTLEIVRMTDTWIHMYIMTSDINHRDTVDFFRAHDYFGYNPDYLHFFVQEHNPSTDFTGKILMKSESSLAMSPNGNGGWFRSMANAGLLEHIFASDLEWINVFAVDNVLQRIADPVFLGATIESGKMCGAKVVRKAAPDEKVGAICLENGKPHIIEYYELSEDMMNHKNADGSLSYSYGVILNYLFPIRRLKDTLKSNLPLHVAKKIIPHIDGNFNPVHPAEPNGLKFETLALDLIHKMDDCLVFEVERDREFAPVKNKTGVDSIDTARLLLQKNGYTL